MNCVPEYYREMFEREDREYQLQEERRECYLRAEEYIRHKRETGCVVFPFPPDECYDCTHGEEAPATSSEDDIPRMICANCRKCAIFRQNMETSYPGTPWTEILAWFN